ncbi:MAG: hypothetical protein ABSE42_23180 [Bryobacteraceae bacterium]|jgi:hypothetical protein
MMIQQPWMLSGIADAGPQFRQGHGFESPRRHRRPWREIDN